jgi:hypothetical protein
VQCSNKLLFLVEFSSISRVSFSERLEDILVKNAMMERKIVCHFGSPTFSIFRLGFQLLDEITQAHLVYRDHYFCSGMN